jgi:hypothetical protein
LRLLAHGRPLLWQPKSLVGHHHSQSLMKFVVIHRRYGRSADLYQAKRRQRGSGTMSQDLAFHSTLPRRARDRLRLEQGVSRQAALLAALILWQQVNAAGYAVEACRQATGRNRV